MYQTKSCFAYLRVSDFKQIDGASLQAQRDAILKFAEEKGFIITQWFEEKETAAKSGRTIFNAMIQKLQKSQADGLLIHKIDRSSRNFADWAKIHDLSDQGVDIHFVTENLDFRTRGGQLTADIQAVFAADYIRNLKEEIAKGMNARLKEGLYPWKAPVGYLDQGKGKAKIIDPVMGPKIQKLFELYATGEHTMYSIVDEAKTLEIVTSGGGYLTKSGVMRILSNPFYTGTIHIQKRNESYQGIHQPLISQSLFETVRSVRQNRSVKKITKHRFTYRGLFKCGQCKSAMVGERKKTLIYYRCHTRGCPTKTVREEILENEIQNTLRTYQLSEPGSNQAKEWIEKRKSEKSTSLCSETAAMQLSKIEHRQKRLMDAYLEGDLIKSEFECRKTELLEQATHLRNLSEKCPSRSQISTNYDKILGMLKSLDTTYFLALPDEKRQILKNLFSERSVIGKSPYFKPYTWSSMLLNGQDGLFCAPAGASSLSYPQVQPIADDLLVQFINCREVQVILGLFDDIQRRNSHTGRD